MRKGEIISIACAVFLLLPLFVAYAQIELDFGGDPSFEYSFDFKEVESGEITHIFKIINASEFVWQIDKIVTSCGCVSAKLIAEGAGENSEIVPGEMFQVEVGVDTAGHEGKIEQFVYLHLLQENETKILKLIMEGEIVNKQKERGGR